jgi:MFS family permease
MPLNASLAAAGPAIETHIPARLDRLPWARFHVAVVLALGITWVLDGLEVTFIGAVGGVLQQRETLHLSAEQVGALASAYVTGAVVGALGFGYLTDRLGRRIIFFVTLGVYLVGVALTAFSWDFWSIALFRLITGLGIGGEYAAINSAIDELIPARLRGRVDLIVNGSFWLGAAMGAGVSLLLLNPRLLPVDIGWRLGFAIGATLGLVILLLRRYVPESPRWLVTHGHQREAGRVVAEIEARVAAETGQPLAAAEQTYRVYPRKVFGFGFIIEAVLSRYRSRGLLCLVLMISQAFLYNSVFFSLGLVLVRFYDVPGSEAGKYFFPLALGNFLGPLLLGHFFDTIGRRKMIAGTFAASAALLVAAGWLFAAQALTATTQLALWTGVFFFASAAASSAYLTVSEIFPLEARALAIAFFYAIGTAAGGIVGPWLFGRLIDSGQRQALFIGYLIAAALLLAASIAELTLGVDAERQPLESIAEPLSHRG